MSNIGSATCTAQVLGITASGLAAGNVINYSLAVVPTILLPSAGSSKRTFDSSEQPGSSISHVATQWRHAYNIGASTMPFSFAVASSAFTYAAHAFRQEPNRRVTTSNMYLLAAALVLAPIPYTLLVMNSTNKKLLGRAQEADSEAAGAKEKTEIRESKEEAVVVNWLKTWTWMNVVRGSFPLAATVVGLCASLCSVD